RIPTTMNARSVARTIFVIRRPSCAYMLPFPSFMSKPSWPRGCGISDRQRPLGDPKGGASPRRPHVGVLTSGWLTLRGLRQQWRSLPRSMRCGGEAPHPTPSPRVCWCLHVAQHADHECQQFLQRVEAPHLAREQVLDTAFISRGGLGRL